MGTRCLTKVYDEQGHMIINMYRQFDGYPTGHGAELAEFLNSGRMVNGLSLDDTQTFFNGAGCLAAQLVADFKQAPGGFYLYPVTIADCGQDYEYHIYTDGGISIKIVNCGVNFFGMTQSDTYETIFDGNLEQFTKYCASEQYGDVELNQPFEDSIVGQETLKDELTKGVVTVVFEKNDGTERTMNCTLSEDIVPPLDTTVVKQKRIQNPDVLAVWDTDANGWRSFRFDSIKSVVYPSVV
jgi:hypothetical protein